MPATFSGISHENAQRSPTASRYVFPALRADAATQFTSNHG